MKIRSVEWHSVASLRCFQVLAFLAFSACAAKYRTYWQSCGYLRNPHTTNVLRLVQVRCQLTHMTFIQFTSEQQNYTCHWGKNMTSHYPRSCHIHVSKGRKHNEYLWVLRPLLCYEKPETWYALVFVVSVLKWILELMGWSSQCIKVKQSDLYFKGCDYSGAGLTDSRE